MHSVSLRFLPLALLFAASLMACSSAESPSDESPSNNKRAATPAVSAVRAVKITTAISQTRSVAVIEQALGRVLDPASSTIAAEVAARVQTVRVDVGDRVAAGDLLATLDGSDMQVAVTTAEADLARNRAQSQAQKRLVARYRKLAKDHFISTTMLDQGEAQLVALQKSVKAATAQLKQARNNLKRTHIVAPVAGIIQQRLVAKGDYIAIGKPMFQLVSEQQFIVSITIPETKIHAIRVGLPVRMHLPNSDQIIAAVIDDITPMIGSASNAFQARIKIRNPGDWHPGGSVVAELITATHQQAVVVPEECVVLRPAGEVVYLLKGNKVAVRTVRTGVQRDGYIEITRGLQAGVTLAATGAAFLTDGATVQIQAPQQ